MPPTPPRATPSPPTTEPLAPALFPTSAYAASTPNEAARRARKPRVADFYTRLGNPTVQAFADAVAELEGAEAGLCSASGMGAVSTVVLGLCSQGDHIVTQRQLFSSTTQLFESVCPRFGIEVTFVDAGDTPGLVAAAAARPTKLLFVETPANPTLEVVDLDAVGASAAEVTAVDSTLAGPLVQRPIGAGIDLVVHSATKSLAGHNDATLGVLAGEKTLVNELWQYATIHGACASPYDSWNGLRGLKTLELRVERQCATAEAVAGWLATRPDVATVHYPFLACSPHHGVARRQMTAGGGTVSFVPRGGFDAAVSCVGSLDVALLAPSLGGPETLVNHPASMTHASLTPEQRAAAGLDDGLIRLSIGLEPLEAIIADLERGLSSAT